MSNSLPENEAPVSLRASTALGVRREQAQAPGNVSAASVQASAAGSLEQAADDGEWITMPVLTAGAVAVLLGTGWLFQRRKRLAKAAEHHPDGVAAEPPRAVEAPVAPAPVAVVPAEESADGMAEFAAQFEDEPAALQPQQTFPAPLEHRSHHSRIGVASQKRVIKGLMWVRTVAGGAAIVAAIAIVVFWAIETTDMRAGDTGLTRPLLALLLVAWSASWGAGQLANQLHRAFFGRVHPKFDN